MADNKKNRILKRVSKTCAQCGKVFELKTKDWRLKTPQTIYYCSRECSAIAHTKDHTKKCVVCGRTFSLSQKKVQCCCVECGRLLMQWHLFEKKCGVKFNSYDEYLSNKDKYTLPPRLSENKEHRRLLAKRNREKNRDKINAKKKIERSKPENKAYMKAYLKKYNEEHREERRIKQRERMISDPLFRFKTASRKMLCQSFRRKLFNKNEKAEKLLGCNLDFFSKYISSKFQKGMTLENFGKWQLDHIIPLATAKTIDDVKRLCHYTNFQPLWAKDNNLKSCGAPLVPTQLEFAL